MKNHSRYPQCNFEYPKYIVISETVNTDIYNWHYD